jgi:hypothetical protein
VANQEHVELLKKDVAEWNAWRQDNPTIHPDLFHADLRRANLRSADLRRANLRSADLIGSYLYGANLRSADLRLANLSDADLRSADLHDALLIKANLTGADLHDAFLIKANLTGADLLAAILDRANLSGANLSFAYFHLARLIGTNLTEAQLTATVFANVILLGVIGLETCVYLGPSSIDHLTLQRSRPLPLAFLRGVGLPDKLIDCLPSLLAKDEYHSCFISYSAKDDEFTKRLHGDLQNKGVRCWFAPHDLPIGAKTWDAIDEAIKLRDKLLLILSKNSIGSDWVEDEVQKAFAEERDRKELVLFPVRIDDAVMETPEPWARKLRDQRNVGDFRRWKDHDAYQESFERVVHDLAVQPRAP